MTDTFRALCAELVEKLDDLSCHYNIPSQSALVERALLAQLEGEELTDEELKQMLFDKHRGAIEFVCDAEEEAHLIIRNHIKFARTAIAADRARRPTPQSPASCPACEGAPDPSNSPCAVCGTEATLPPRQRGDRQMSEHGIGIRYLLCPGYVTSKHDGQDHFINAQQLARLYGVSLKECRILDPRYRERSEFYLGLTYLRPRFDGNYTLPTESPNSGI